MLSAQFRASGGTQSSYAIRGTLVGTTRHRLEALNFLAPPLSFKLLSASCTICGRASSSQTPSGATASTWTSTLASVSVTHLHASSPLRLADGLFYPQLFGTARVPTSRGCKMASNEESKHVVVIRRGQFCTFHSQFIYRSLSADTSVSGRLVRRAGLAEPTDLDRARYPLQPPSHRLRCRQDAHQRGS